MSSSTATTRFHIKFNNLTDFWQWVLRDVLGLVPIAEHLSLEQDLRAATKNWVDTEELAGALRRKLRDEPRHTAGGVTRAEQPAFDWKDMPGASTARVMFTYQSDGKAICIARFYNSDGEELRVGDRQSLIALWKHARQQVDNDFEAAFKKYLPGQPLPEPPLTDQQRAAALPRRSTAISAVKQETAGR